MIYSDALRFALRRALNGPTTYTSDSYSGFGAQWGYFADNTEPLEVLTNRWYDAGTGRMLSREPAANAWNSNLYEYAGDDASTWAGSLDIASLKPSARPCPPFSGPDANQIESCFRKCATKLLEPDEGGGGPTDGQKEFGECMWDCMKDTLTDANCEAMVCRADPGLFISGDPCDRMGSSWCQQCCEVHELCNLMGGMSIIIGDLRLDTCESNCGCDGQ